jgi:hypothetical protein
LALNAGLPKIHEVTRASGVGETPALIPDRVAVSGRGHSPAASVFGLVNCTVRLLRVFAFKMRILNDAEPVAERIQHRGYQDVAAHVLQRLMNARSQVFETLKF